MLTSATIVAQLATADLDAARAFYGGKLGFSSMLDSEQAVVFQATDGSSVIVYSRPNHVAPGNTVASFLVDDIAAEAADLQARGVTLEQYDMPGATWSNGVVTQPDGHRSAWFKDPAGNILALELRPPAA